MIPFDLYIEATDDHWSSVAYGQGGPAFVRVRINNEFLAMILRRREECRKENATLSLLEEPDSWDGIDRDPGAPVASWGLIFDKETFQFRGRAVGSRYRMSATDSRPVSIGDLRRWATGPRTEGGNASQQDDPRVRWVAGSLLYTESDMRNFQANILVRCPDIAARKLGLDMAGRSANTEAGSPGAGTSTVPRRRPGAA